MTHWILQLKWDDERQWKFLENVLGTYSDACKRLDEMYTSHLRSKKKYANVPTCKVRARLARGYIY
jgi:hypothetical protein